MQTKESLENWYKFLDPWNYQNTPDDLKRKEIILKHIEPCDTILDIGAGEGWITKDLPANEIYAIELSDIAASRFPKNVIRVSEPTDRKSTRLNSSHVKISYAVFCLKKKNKRQQNK